MRIINQLQEFTILTYESKARFHACDKIEAHFFNLIFLFLNTEKIQIKSLIDSE